MNAHIKDVGYFLKTAAGGYINSIVAGGSGDATEYSGPWVAVGDAASVKVVITARTTLAATKTLTITANLQDATDSSGTGAADFGAAGAATAVLTGAVTNGLATYEMDFNLDANRGYIRTQVTPDLSAADTDTANLTITYVFGGYSRNPASARAN